MYQQIISLPPFRFKVSSTFQSVVEHVNTAYPSNLERNNENKFINFDIAVKRPNSLRSLLKPQCIFESNALQPFKPLPASQAHALLEWGMNWCVASSEFNYLIIHAAVLAKDDKAIIFPAPPGSGKSTLTAHLAFSGWRLLSDEMALIDLSSGCVHPFVRAICLKNNSIDLVKAWFPEAAFSGLAKDTVKGDVSHVRPPQNATDNAWQQAEIKGIVFPKYRADTFLDIYPMQQCETMMHLINNAFNFNIVHTAAFDILSHIIPKTKHFEISYNNLSEVSDFLESEIIDS